MSLVTILGGALVRTLFRGATKKGYRLLRACGGNSGLPRRIQSMTSSSRNRNHRPVRLGSAFRAPVFAAPRTQFSPRREAFCTSLTVITFGISMTGDARCARRRQSRHAAVTV